MYYNSDSPYIDNRKEKLNARVQRFLDKVAEFNLPSSYDDRVQEEVDTFGTGEDYFNFKMYDNFEEIIDMAPKSQQEKNKALSWIQNSLSRLGCSVDNPVYCVDWGAEPMYLTVSNRNTLIVVEAPFDRDPIITSLNSFLNSIKDPVERIQYMADIELALNNMGISIEF